MLKIHLNTTSIPQEYYHGKIIQLEHPASEKLKFYMFTERLERVIYTTMRDMINVALISVAVQSIVC